MYLKNKRLNHLIITIGLYEKSCIAPNNKFIGFLLGWQIDSYIIMMNNNRYLGI